MSSPYPPRVVAALAIACVIACGNVASAQPLGYAERPQPPPPHPWVAGSVSEVPPRPSSGDAKPVDDDEDAAEKEHRSFGGDVALATHAPIFVGAQGTLKLPYGFLFQAELGVLPSFYVSAVDGALVSANVYSNVVSSLVTSGLEDSFVLRLSGGIRPFAGHGFEVLGGYTLTTLGGGVSARAALEAVGGVALPAQVPDAEIGLQTTLHNLHVSVGWRWLIADHFLVRASIGYLQTVASSSHIEVPDSASSIPGASAIIEQANQTIDATLDSNYKSYVKLPLLGLALGYSF